AADLARAASDRAPHRQRVHPHPRRGAARAGQRRGRDLHRRRVPGARLSNPDMTAARFVTGSGMASDETLYRTDDRGRYCKDGVIEFLGRVDSQIKVRGFRIEPEEVEITLQRHPAVQAAAVTAGPGASGASRMIAYVQPHVGHE